MTAAPTFESTPCVAARRRVLALVSLLFVCLACLPGAAGAQNDVGELTQPAGTAGCISQPVTDQDCAAGFGLDLPHDVVVSPDGRHAYLASWGAESTVTTFDRDPDDGTLEQKPGTAGCVAQEGDDVTCKDGRGLDGAGAVAVSPDGTSVYVGSYSGTSIAIFDRDPVTGVLTQKEFLEGCIKGQQPESEGCTDGRGVGNVAAVAVSPDGRHVYATSVAGIAIFDRETGGTPEEHGALEQKAGTAGCISHSGGSSNEGCSNDGRAISLGEAVAISPDGESLYVVNASVDWLAVFKREADGTLDQMDDAAGCFSDPAYDFSDDSCGHFREGDSPGASFFNATDVVVSPDNEHVYVTVAGAQAVAAFERDSAGALTPHSCVSSLVANCGTTTAPYPWALAISPDGRSVYVASGSEPTDPMTIFDRAASGTLEQKGRPAGCHSRGGDNTTCREGRGLGLQASVTVSPDGGNVYVASAVGGFGGDNAISIFKRVTPPPPEVSIGDFSSDEGDSGTTPFTFTVSLSDPAPAGGVSVDYATADGSASAGSDYTTGSGTIAFTAGGEMTKEVTVLVGGDTVGEPDEDFFVNLSGLTGGTPGDMEGQGTIVNDDTPPPSLSIEDVEQAEGNAGTTAFEFDVTLSSPAPAGGVSVDYATSNGSATAGSDYTAASGTLEIAENTSGGTIIVNVSGDTASEPHENFNLQLSNPDGIALPLSDNQALGTIENDDVPPPSLSIADASTTEGNTGTKTLIFPVTLSPAAPAGGLTVDFATVDGSAGAGSDYTATNGTLTFVEGDSVENVSVTVNGDTAVEPDEDFFVNLSNAPAATIADNQAKGTIQNDDQPPPTLSIDDDVSQAEGNAGTTAFGFTVTLSEPAPAGGVTVDYASADGSATAGSDYAATSGALNFAAGESVQVVTVQVSGDTAFEPDEDFVVELSSAQGATLGADQGEGTIQNDDPQAIVDPPPPPSVSISDVAKREGNSGTTAFTFGVGLSAPAPASGVTVDYATANGSATAGSDYAASSGRLSFAAGQTLTTLTVQVSGDTAFEPSEDFFVNLSNPQGATLATPQGTVVDDAHGRGLIQDDDERLGWGGPSPPRPAIVGGGGVCGGRGCVRAKKTTAISAKGKFSPWTIGGLGPAPRTSARRPTLRVPAPAGACRFDLDVSLRKQSYARFDSKLRRSLFNDPSYRRPKAAAARARLARKRSGNLTLARGQFTVPAESQRKVRLRATRKGRRLLLGSLKRHRSGTFKATLRVAVVCNGFIGVATNKRTIRLKLETPGRRTGL